MFSVQSSLKIYSKRKTDQGFDCINSYFEEVFLYFLSFNNFKMFFYLPFNHQVNQSQDRSEENEEFSREDEIMCSALENIS